jgi:hypothetical protein
MGTSSRPACDRIAQLILEVRQEKITDHMRGEYAKADKNEAQFYEHYCIQGEV